MKLTICITLRNRADFMKGKLDELANMNYDPKEIEICITDGYSDDGIVDLLKENAHRFYQIKYAISDRSALPFIIPFNNPACDVNAQICNVATFDTIIRTDAEVRFTHRDSLTLIKSEIDANNELCLCFWCQILNDSGVVTQNTHMSGFCSAFSKEAFIRNRGIDERFAIGFAGEDSYFHHWWTKNRVYKNAPKSMTCQHLWHGETTTPERQELRQSYTLPMYRKFVRDNETPNRGNDDWQRPEMIKDIQIWKD